MPVKEYLSRTRILVLGGLALVILAEMGLTGCAVGPHYSKPPVSVPTAYKEADQWKVANPSDAIARGKWWELFGDPQLNSLEDRVEVSNQNLKMAQARYREAVDQVQYSRAGFFPTITAGLSASTIHTSDNQVPHTPTAGSTYSRFSLPVQMSYEADAWGRIRHTVTANREEAQATAADLATVNLSLHAELALDYFAARTLDAEEQLLKSTVQEYQKAVELTNNRFHAGIASQLDVEQAQTQLENTRSQAMDIGVARAQYEHAVASLVGENASSFTLPPLPLTAPPPAIPAGLPSQLLERRPDIAAAERRMAAANENVGVARAAWFPTIGLGATGGFESGSITTLLSGPSMLWAFGPSAVGTLLDFGKRRANEQFAKDVYQENVANYRQNVLTAFQQVEDNLAAIRILQSEAVTQDAAVHASDQALQISMNRYRGGLTSYLEVITAQSTALQSKRTAVGILGRRMGATVALIRALGGGWNSAALQNPTMAAQSAGAARAAK